jgi:excisionase family DNA binding protein
MANADMSVNLTNDMISRRAYSIAEVAAAYGFSKSFVRLEIARGRLKALHVGRRVVIPRDAMRNWLEGGPSSDGGARTVNER